jgi:outer membrane protein OmpA-like peptidoglycan-associated protein
MFTNFKLAEGGKDIKSTLMSEGKIVTHGILFDTGSDKIKPESLPTLKKILAILEESPALNFSIEGHTDNQGTRELNQTLSEKRAKAVQLWLTGKGIPASRLQSKGWGDTKPIDTNDTPEGRANNRRVEFTKIGHS